VNLQLPRQTFGAGERIFRQGLLDIREELAVIDTIEMGTFGAAHYAPSDTLKLVCFAHGSHLSCHGTIAAPPQHARSTLPGNKRDGSESIAPPAEQT
jgi:hypothetical protein